MNLLVEIKNEYLNRIKENMKKNFYDGLQSIYNKADEVSGNDDVLKVFQSFLKRVPKWTEEIVSNEVLRIRQILEIDNKYELTNDLIKACLKSSYNIMIFGLSDDLSFDIKQYLNDFSFKDFIKKVYIEASRNVYNNPFLFYHNYSPIEIKRNQRDVLEIIEHAIDSTIRNMLPIKIILNSYLNSNNKIFKISYPSNINAEDQDDDIINNLLKEDLENDIYKNLADKSLEVVNENKKDIIIDGPINNLKDLETAPSLNALQSVDPSANRMESIQQETNPLMNTNQNIQSNIGIDESIPQVIDNINSPVIKVSQNQIGGNNSIESIKKNSDDSQSMKSVNNKILDIINEKSLDLSRDTKSMSDFENSRKDTQTAGSNVNETFIANNSELSLSKDEKIAKQSLNSHSVDTNKQSNSLDSKKTQSELDSKLEKLLKNDLGDTDTDSTMAVDNQSNYQEVFSNSNGTDLSLNSQQKHDEITKNRFFSNYLQL